MSNNKDCQDRRQAIAALVLEELEPKAADELRDHINACETCRSLYEALTDEEKSIRSAFGAIAARSQTIQHGLVERFGKQTAAADKAVGRRKIRDSKFIWRMIMKSKTTKLAAAAVIIIVAAIGLNQLAGPIDVAGTAFADVVEPFLSARTATYTATLQVEGGPTQIFDGMFMEPGRLRQTDQQQGGIVISDLEKGKVITLIAAQKRAIVWDIVNLPEDPGQFNPFLEIRRRILEASQAEDECVEFLGAGEVEGRAAIGYHVQKAGADITIWADAETKIPIRMENIMGPATCTISEIVFDVDLDESLFSLDIPEDYSVHTLQMDGSEPTEKDVIEMFRIWTEHMDGSFPSALEMDVTMEFMQYQQQKMMQEGQIPSKEEMMDRIMEMQKILAKMQRGFTFVQQLPSESHWHYAGKGLKLGESNQPIFWYRPEDSQTYRVIYGDLRPADVQPEDLPTEYTPE